MASNKNLRLLVVAAVAVFLLASTEAVRLPTSQSPSGSPTLTFSDFLPIKKPSPKTLPKSNDGDDTKFLFEGSLAIESNDGNPEVKKVCASTENPLLCAGSVDTILEAAVKAGLEVAKQAKAMAKELIENPEMSAELRSIVKDCKESYSTAAENFEKSLAASTQHDVGTIRSMLSGTITYLGDCRDEIGKVQTDPRLNEFAVKLGNMTSNCLAIVDLMH
ncbi:uncharacterized protein LOC127250173 [Andrographis paniculata]|uniref:uncharacterized protein LOC127250173 n=1 Tax=Andrographis paniculata TaxID=175694 RepID=UPI0021E7584A|nr:uncharacterized protein LOC127250173 [Andrographis paniculata]